MPIYEYRCSDCGHELEALQKISDPKLTTCPECGKETLTKLVSASAFVLKGSGWYVTDFRDKNKSGAGEGKASGSGKADAGESKTDAKAGEKTDNKKSESADSKKTDSKPAKKAAGE